MDRNEMYLTKMLRGESMGINLYDMYIKKIPEGKYKREIESIKAEHLRHKTRIQNIMEHRNMEAGDEIGIQGLMTEAMTKARLIFRNDPKKVIREAYRGEKMGVVYSEKYLNEFSEDIRPDMEKIVREAKERIKRLEDIVRTL